MSCRIIETANRHVVKGTCFKDRNDADLYAYFLAIVLKNGEKLIYMKDADEAIQLHNKLEGKRNDEWLKVC